MIPRLAYRALAIFMTLLLMVPQLYSVDLYMAPGGSNGNSGLDAAHPWLSPLHNLNCGDKIHAAPGAYLASSFSPGNWGTVSNCGTGDAASVAWVWCDTFDSCKIAGASAPGMFFSKSNWGVQGFEVTTTGTNAPCFMVIPLTSTPVHHIIFANNFANGCISSGITTSNFSTTVSTDYIVAVGNIAWNATQTAALCDSGITIYTPIKTDSLPGTHLYLAGNFAFDNLSGVNCAGGAATYDGNGVVLDDIGGSQQGVVPYDQQVVIENNIVVWNGGYGTGATGGGTSAAPIHIRYNTSYGNLKATTNSATTCGDMTLLGNGPGLVRLSQVYRNIVMTNRAIACSGQTTPLYAMVINGGDASDGIFTNWLYSATGTHTLALSSTGFSFGSNTTGFNPAFANPIDPGRPNCTGKLNVPDCMATVIANYTPTLAPAKAYGYQIPNTAGTLTPDPLFPKWLCNVGINSLQLVSMPCAPGAPTGLNAIVH